MAVENLARVVVLTQACDLAEKKTNRVLLAIAHEAAALVEQKVLKNQMIRDNIRRGQVFGWYFLPSSEGPVLMPEAVVDLRDLHTVRLDMLEDLLAQGKGVCRLATPYREHLNQHFAVTYMRIGLPEPYVTEA